MKEKVRQAIRNFRRSNPHTTRWNDEQVLEAMFLLAAQQTGRESGLLVAAATAG